MRFSIHSRALGRDVTFSRPGHAYVYVDLNGQPGTLGNQICYHGQLTGDTITYSGDEQPFFDGLCRSWWNMYLRHTSYERALDRELEGANR